MADEKLVFPIGFDTQSGKDDAKRDTREVLDELQKLVDKHPLKVKMEISKEDRSSMRDFADILRKMSENAKKGTKDLSSFKAKMAELNRQWDKLTASQRAGAEGNALRQQYRDLAREAGGYTSTLQSSVRAEDKSNQALEKKRQKLIAANAEYQKQDGYVKRLITRLGLYSAIFAGVRFAKQIRETTAEFELQRVSLGALIQDTEKAEQLFSQIKAAAVKSPFEIKDLVSYTKQLAAYKIEANDLFDTMMRLSDISAGLGADMSRIVLAYGQIKGAGVLKGTELRQITELGIPMVDLLAQKLTDLRGELVTTGDVFKLISEKAISFTTVKEIFDDMTNAGGMFYKMQEKQSETLAGRWSNLKDSISIAYDEMGNTKLASGAMNAMIAILKGMADHWKTVYDLVAGVSGALITYIAASKAATVATTALTIRQAYENALLKSNTVWMPKFVAGLMSEAKAKAVAEAMSRRLIKARVAEATATGMVSKALARLRVALLSNPYAIAIAAIVGLSAAIFNFVKHAKTAKDRAEELNESVAKLQNKQDSVGVLIKRYEELSHKVERTAAEQKELNKVTKQLADTYPGAINQVKEYGKELGLSAEKAKALYEAEQELMKGQLEKQLDKDEKKLKKLQTQYNSYADQLISGETTISDEFGNEYIVPLSESEISRIKKNMDNLEGDIKSLSEAVYNARVALGRETKKAEEDIDKNTTPIQKKLKSFMVDVRNASGEKVRLFQDNEIDAMSSQADAIAKAVDIYKERDEKIKTLTASLKNLSPEERKETEASIATSQAYKDAAYAVLEYFNALGKLEGKDEAADNRLQMLQEEVRLLEQVYTKFKEYQKSMSSDKAIEKTRQYFGDTISSLRFGPAFDSKTMIEFLGKYQAAMKSLPKSEKAVLEVGFKADNISWEDFKENIKRNIERISGEISQSRAAQDFFNNILGLTGDRDLSANLTMSVYGDLGTGLAGKVKEQLNEAFRAFDVSALRDAITKATDEAGRAVAEADLGKVTAAGGISDLINNKDYATLLRMTKYLPKEMQSAAESLVKNLISDNERAMESYAKLLVKFTDTAQQRLIIEQQTSEQIRKLNEGEAIALANAASEAEKEMIKARTSAARQALLGERDLSIFKLSDDYIRYFSAINTMSSSTAATVRNELRNAMFKAFQDGAISADELKKELRAIDQQFKKLQESSRLFATYLTGGIEGALNKIQTYSDEIGGIGAKMQKMGGIGELADADRSFIDKYLKIFGGKGNNTFEKAFANAGNDVKQMGQNLTNMSGQMSATVSNAAGALSIVDTIIRSVHQAISAVSQVIDQVNSMRSEENQTGKGWKFLADFDKYAFSGWENLKSGNVFGAIADTIGSILSIFQNIQANKIKRLNDAIKEQTRLIEDLGYAYGRLEAAKDSALGSEYIQNYRQRTQALLAEQNAYLKQAELERAKGKKADSEKVREYEQQARDAADKVKDSLTELQDHIAGTDITSAARDFASAWLDAYKDFSSTTDAMQDKFADMIQNMIVEGLAAELVRNVLQPIYDSIGKAAEDGVIDANEIAAIADAVPGAIQEINTGMNVLIERLKGAGLDIRQQTTGLTGISKDVATASEESILGLTAGINTQNFYISQIHANVAAILAKMGGTPSVSGGIDVKALVELQNQHLAYLPVIAQRTADILVRCERAATACESMSRNIGRVIVPKGSQSSHQVSVTLN